MIESREKFTQNFDISQLNEKRRLVNNEDKEEQPHESEVQLFFSFDIVNSTKFKNHNISWAIIIKSLLRKIIDNVSRVLPNSKLWRTLGDEVVFIQQIKSEEEIYESVSSVFELCQDISNILESGSFFKSVKEQTLTTKEIELLCSFNQDQLSVKAAMWIAVVKESPEEIYDNISFTNATPSIGSNYLKEYLGNDIDIGFRIKNQTKAKQVVLSFELAYLISDKEKNNLHFFEYKVLKGVWDEKPYPIIFYYNSKNREGREVKFEDNLLFEELLNPSHNRSNCKMYESGYALKKIANEMKLLPKIDYIRSKLVGYRSGTVDKTYPLEMHCAVVCCDVEERKIFIVHSGNEHRNNKDKWEFGCAKALSGKKLVESIKEYYKSCFSLDIELVVDNEREEKQPIPIAVYEVGQGSNIRKGVIFVAKVIRKENSDFRPTDSYMETKWISENEIDEYKDVSVMDFCSTLRTVFDRFDSFFGVMK